MNLGMQLNLAINQAIEMREQNADNGSVFYIVSPPGAGKTQMTYEFCKNSNLGLIACTPALERQEKFGGIPDLKYVKADKFNINSKDADEEYLITEWSVPDLIAKANKMSKDHEYVVILLDDWHLCAPNIQQIGFELFTHRSLNGCKVADNIVFILAGNNTSAAGAKVQMSAILNRCVVLHAKADIKQWLDYAASKNLHPSCFGFFSSVENQAYFHEEESTNEPFGSPRSWTTFFTNLKILEDNFDAYGFSKAYRKNIVLALLQGCVSKVAAEKFHIFYEIFSKVDLESIFSKGYGKGTGNEVPRDTAQAYAHTYAVTSKYYDLYVQDILEKITPKERDKNLEKHSKIWWQLMEELYKENKSELATKSTAVLMGKTGSVQSNVKLLSGAHLLAEQIKKGFIPSTALKKIEQTKISLGKISKGK